MVLEAFLAPEFLSLILGIVDIQTFLGPVLWLQHVKEKGTYVIAPILPALEFLTSAS